MTRSFLHLLETARLLEPKQRNLIFLRENSDTNTATDRYFLSMMGAPCRQRERDLRGEPRFNRLPHRRSADSQSIVRASTTVLSYTLERDAGSLRPASSSAAKPNAVLPVEAGYLGELVEDLLFFGSVCGSMPLSGNA